MGNYTYNKDFEDFVLINFPEQRDLSIEEKWSTFGKTYFQNKLGKSDNSSYKITAGTGRCLLVSTNSGSVSLEFLNWLECHAYLGYWTNFNEAKTQLFEYYKRECSPKWGLGGHMQHEFESNAAARQAHSKFIDAAMREGYIPEFYLPEDVRECFDGKQRTLYWLTRIRYDYCEDYMMFVFATSPEAAIEISRRESKDFASSPDGGIIASPVLPSNVDSVLYTVHCDA